MIHNKEAPTILLVDDDEDLLAMVSYKLKKEGFQTLISINGERVKEIVDLSRPDLILLDIHMQGIHGGDICKQIKADPLTRSIPILLFSANENIKTIREECGADGFLVKPLEGDVLMATLQQYLHHVGASG